ncbi:hypothetical protein HanRHA438_Chr14g0662011 [Helianthus annuus]|nr:hypothetical protein HanRHA438_Chr14g0662011 [Helianthus annuus]
MCAGTIRRTGGSFKTLKHMKSSKIKEKSSKEIRALTKIVITKLRGSEGGSLWMKRVKRSAYGKKGVAWMQGHSRLKTTRVKRIVDIMMERSEIWQGEHNHQGPKSRNDCK